MSVDTDTTSDTGDVLVVSTEFYVPTSDDPWCYLVARADTHAAAVTWATQQASKHQRRYRVVRGGGRFHRPRPWLIYPENIERVPRTDEDQAG